MIQAPRHLQLAGWQADHLGGGFKWSQVIWVLERLRYGNGCSFHSCNSWTIEQLQPAARFWTLGQLVGQAVSCLTQSENLLQEYPMHLPQSRSLLRHLYPLQLGSSSPEKDFSGRRIMGEQKGWGHLLRNAISGARRAPCKRRQQDTPNYSKSRTHLQMLPQSQPNDVLWSPIHSNKENGQHSDVHYQTGVYCNPSFLYLGIV